jgi:hypothetical protein
LSLTGKGADQIVTSSLLTDLAQFLQSRKDMQTCAEYDCVQKQVKVKYDQINNQVNDDLKKLLLDYDIAKSDLEGICSDQKYKQGFCDGIKTLMQILLI